MDDREHTLNRVLVDFAANLCSDFSVQSILEHLVTSTVDLLPVSAAGVMALDAHDELHFIAATDEVVRIIEGLQRQMDEGLCLQAHRSGRHCAVDDLSLGADFPEFSRRTVEAGMAAVFSFPLRAADLNLGALDLYRATPGPLDEEDMPIASVLADLAAAYLTNARSRADFSLLLADPNHRSLHDALTGLPNRTLLAELLADALHRALRSRRRIAVLLIDLDDFKVVKAVNDRLGHHVGDQLLIAVSPRLTAALRPGDTLARLGGDEFVAVCDDLPDESRAADVAHRLLTAMAHPFPLNRQDLELGTSIGIALSDRRHPTDAQHLLATVDAATYEAKRAGGQRHHPRYATRSDHSPTAPHLRTTGDSLTARTARPDRRPLGNPVSHEGFSTVYQRVVGFRDQAVVAVETLLRWRSLIPGAAPFSIIIDEAERSGAILALGDWVLRRACRDAQRWRGRDSGAQLTSVNVSAQQITGSAFVRTLEGVLTGTGLDPASLRLELTESAVRQHNRRTVDVLRNVKQLGAKLWLDDFGSGYSSLNYLRVFPLDAVKIDPSFAQRLTSQRSSRVIIASTTALCHDLGLDVIVEGIENADDLSAATELGVDAVQGFHLGRALSADEIFVLLEGGHREEPPTPAGARSRRNLTPRHRVTRDRRQGRTL